MTSQDEINRIQIKNYLEDIQLLLEDILKELRGKKEKPKYKKDEEPIEEEPGISGMFEPKDWV